MSLAQNYAALLKEGNDPEKTLAYMKAKGHQSILPQVVRILERQEDDGGVVLVAKKEDAEAVKDKFPDARIIVDTRIVGGYFARTKDAKVIDATYRKALVTIYKAAIQ